MRDVIEYLKPVIEDENGQPSRKRIIELMCVTTACVLTTTTCIWKYNHPELDVATLTMLIGPLFVTAATYSGITSYYQNKTNELSDTINRTGN